jgi:predicted Rossmann-fold nucleotide-binding protein
MFEILTLAQTQKLAKKITVLIYGPQYWKKVFNLEALVDTGAISPKDIDLFQYADTPQQAFELLKQGLTENYLAAEAANAAAAARPEGGKAGSVDDLMAGWNLDDFLGPELAKTRK